MVRLQQDLQPGLGADPHSRPSEDPSMLTSALSSPALSHFSIETAHCFQVSNQLHVTVNKRAVHAHRQARRLNGHSMVPVMLQERPEVSQHGQ